MKKMIALLLTLIMMFSLCGFGKSDDIKSYDVSKDERFKFPDWFNEIKFSESYERNKVRTKDEYIGNVYRLRAYIYEIEEEHVIAYTIPNDENIEYAQVSFKIPMATESIKNLYVNQVIKITGEIESIDEVSDIILVSFNEKNTVEDVILLGEDIDRLKKTWNESGQKQIKFIETSNMTVLYFHLDDKDEIDKIFNSKESGSYVIVSAKVFYDTAFYLGPFCVHFDIDSISKIIYRK